MTAFPLRSDIPGSEINKTSLCSDILGNEVNMTSLWSYLLGNEVAQSRFALKSFQLITISLRSEISLKVEQAMPSYWRPGLV